MIDRKPIAKLEALVATLSALTSPERYWLYKMVENVVLYDRVIDGATAATDTIDFGDELDKLLDEWYEIQIAMKNRFDNDTIASLNGRVIPLYRVYRRRNDVNE